MPKISIKIPAIPATRYPIWIQANLLQQPQRWLPKPSAVDNIVIITDHRVKKLYGRTLTQTLQSQGWRVLLLAFPAGEHSKNQHTKQQLEEKMLRAGCGRNTLCLALGGGVTGDLSGFIAATYLRGIPVIQIPTTLLAMVDSSVGGKTAIDTVYGKNLIGAFWQPMAVISDIDCLQSLPQTQWVNGLIEAVKMFLTSDRRSFQWLQKQLPRCLSRDNDVVQTLIQRAVAIKAAVVAQDVREQRGPRAILNFGHTIGHALEKVTGYKMLHGYAVAYGILVEAKIAELSGILPTADFAIIAALLAELGIYAGDLKKYSITALIRATRHDKKSRSGKVHYVLLETIGAVHITAQNYVHPVPDNIVKHALHTLLEANNAGK